ncbi:MAG: sulfotransferase family 2 domain-containing protein, partial [Ruegeria sp.]
EDLDQLDVLNGLAKWLGTDARLTGLNQSLTRQNPASLTSKVVNPDEMDQAVAQMDWLDAGDLPNLEPQRGPAVSRYIAACNTPLLYLPVRGGPNAQVERWLAALDSADPDELISNHNQKQMRQWLRAHPENRKFTVLRHPLARAHSVFCERILDGGPGAYVSIRNTLRKRFKLPIPPKCPDSAYSQDQHREAFAAFLVFLRQNLAGQTPIRVDGAWCSQAQTIAGFSSFAMPDQILREDEMITALPDLARRAGHPNPPMPEPAQADAPYALADIYDPELDALAAKAYRRDYLLFGFDGWKPE